MRLSSWVRSLRAHDLIVNSLVEELASPGWRDVIPELMKVLLEQIGADALEVVAQEIA